MNDVSHLESRKLYEKEAFFGWEKIKNALPECIHMDLVSGGSELRVFISIDGDRDPTMSFINFGLSDGKPQDASFIMKNYHHIDFHGIPDEEISAAWDKYGCEAFIASGAVSDVSKTELYNIILGGNSIAEIEEV